MKGISEMELERRIELEALALAFPLAVIFLEENVPGGEACREVILVGK